jgi:hypothetical protein
VAIRSILKHIDDKVLDGYQESEIPSLGWTLQSKMFILTSIKSYAHTISLTNGWLTNPEQDLVKLDDSWLKLAQIMHDSAFLK